jgi:hypothetical protein
VGSPLSAMCLELVSPGARKMMRPGMADDAWVICVRASGSDNVLARYRNELGLAITRELEGVAESEMWRAIQTFPDPAKVSGNGMSVFTSSHRIQIIVPPGCVLKIIETLKTLSADDEIGVALTGRVGVGHIQAVVWSGTSEPSTVLSKVVGVLGRSATDIAIRVEGALNPWPIAPSNLASMGAVKRALDPKNILRGREIF